jgi:hypothetical protein
MVTSVNKWLSISLAGYFFIIQSFGLASNHLSSRPLRAGRSKVVTGLHPLHVSTTEINHNAIDKILEISCHIFTDDFETVLSKQFNTRADLSSANLKTQMDTLVKKYIKSRLQIKADDKTTVMQYVGFEKEDQAIYAYFEVDNVASVKKIDVTDTILHDLYDDQISIIHVLINGNRKSTKLDYPAKQASFSF